MAQKAEEIKSDPVRYTGWFDVNDQESNRKRNQAFFERSFGGFTKKQQEKAMEQANELIENLSEAEIKRGNTSRTLTDLALSIVGRKENIGITTVLLKMEAMVVLGSPRGGGTGEAASKAGEAGRAELIAMDIGISMDEIKKAQKVLEEDEKATMRLNEIYAKLERTAEDIRPSFPHLESAKTILCFFLVASANRRHSATSRQRYLAGLLATILARTTATKKSGKIVKRISDEVSSCLISTLADVFPKGALETPKDTVESILGPFYFPAVLKREGEEPELFNRPFDIYTFLMAVERESSGYSAFRTGTLSELEMRFDLQRAAMKQLQLEIPKLSTETLEEMFQEEFKILLETISSSNEVNEIVKEEVISYFCDCEKEEGWSDTFESLLTGPLDDYFEALARTLKFLDQNMNRNELIQSEDIVDLTFLAHGQVKCPLLPCNLSYMNGYVKSITFYEPWGCAIDATAAYGILTGTIRVHMVSYTSEVKPAKPRDWNTLPRDYTEIPEVVFTHVDHTETAYRRLQELFRHLQGSTKGFVLRYLSFPGQPAVQEISLCALCHAVAIVGFIFQKRFRIHVAACLTPTDESVLTTEIFPKTRLPTVKCRQYCVVPVENLHRRVFMTMDLDDLPAPESPENIPEETFNVLNEFLYTI